MPFIHPFYPTNSTVKKKTKAIKKGKKGLLEK
jgi:hypothetical protein